MEENEDYINMNYLYNQSNPNQNNELENNLNALCEFNHNLSSIEKASSLPMSSVKTLKEKLNYIKIPYPPKNEIQLIKIENDNLIKYGRNSQYIDNYISALKIFSDYKFNQCGKCEKENTFFCLICNKNICEYCSIYCKRNNHKLIELEEFRKEVKQIKLKINQFIPKYFILPKEKESSEIIEKKNKIYDIMDGLEFEANNEIEEKPIEYTNDILLIQAIIEKNYNNYFHYLNIKECFNYLRKKYEDKIDFITIYYKIEDYRQKTRIFGKIFVNNNEDNCHIIIDGKKYNLMEFIEFKNNRKNKILEVKLIGVSKIIEASSMFDGCESLISINNISNWNTYNVKNMISMFRGCKYLESLPGINDLKTDNVEYMNNMFSGCISLKPLPDISNWNTSNVIDMSDMFSDTKPLNSELAISKFELNNFENFELISLNEIYNRNMNEKTLISKLDIFKRKLKSRKNIKKIQKKKENLEFNKLEDENNHLPDYQQFLERNNTFS